MQPLEASLVLIGGGWFMMGADDGAEGERPIHRVRVNPYELGQFQVTNAEYLRFVETTGHPAPPWIDDPAFHDPVQPVVGVSWHDAVAYCAWLRAITTRGFRLPTEAEWENAARGGAEGLKYPWGNDRPRRPDAEGGQKGGPNRVGLRDPNGFELFDMCENVHEWCSDWFDAGYYAASPLGNPQGPETGSRRVSRGGSWRHQIRFSRCAARSSLPPEFRYSDYGFRVACDTEVV